MLNTDTKYFKQVFDYIHKYKVDEINIIKIEESEQVALEKNIIEKSKESDLANLIKNKTKLVDNFKFINNSGTGIVLKIDIDDEEYIIKTGSTIEDNDNIIHEFVVSKLCINNLINRFNIPNFSYGLGLFKCGGIVLEEKNVISLCKSDSPEPQYYIINEFLNGISFGHFLMKCSAEEFLLMFIQILLALNKGLKEYDLTHYDLHPGNIRMRNISRDRFYISCYMNDEEKYLLSEVDYIPVIFDYGFSHIKVDSKDYGHNFIEFNVFRDRSSPLFDAYKLLISSIDIIIKSKNKNCYPIFELLEYFGTHPNEVIEVIKEQRKYYYSIPYTFNTARNIQEWINFIKKYGIKEEYVEGMDQRLINSLDDFIDYLLDKLGYDIIFDEMEYDIDLLYCEFNNIYFEEK